MNGCVYRAFDWMGVSLLVQDCGAEGEVDMKGRGGGGCTVGLCIIFWKRCTELARECMG